MSKIPFVISEFFWFGIKELRSCIFAGSFFTLLIFSRYITTFGLERYDFLFLACLGIQGALIYCKLESVDELKTILVFHAIGLALELYKTSPGINEWSYPEPAIFKIGTVPLYSGFMYSAVASYIIQAWRQLDLEFHNLPPRIATIALSIATYLNFFTNVYWPDIRWILIPTAFVLFARSTVTFKITTKRYQMPVLLGFILISFFIWVAENFATFFEAYRYQNQHIGWNLVHIKIASSWFLLFMISFMIVVDLKQFKEGARKHSGQANLD